MRTSSSVHAPGTNLSAVATNHPRFLHSHLQRQDVDPSHQHQGRHALQERLAVHEVDGVTERIARHEEVAKSMLRTEVRSAREKERHSASEGHHDTQGSA